MRWIVAVFITTCLLSPAIASAKPLSAWGPYALPNESGNCLEIPDHLYKVLPGYEPSEDDVLAFSGGVIGNKLCYNALYPEQNDVVTMFDWAYMINIMGGYALGELPTPQLAITGPLEDCWPQDLLFEDFNGDDAPDILMMISCFNVAEQKEIWNNTFWYTAKEQGEYVWKQDARLTGVIAPYPSWETARAALIPAMPGAEIEEVPPPPPGNPPPPVPQEQQTQSGLKGGGGPPPPSAQTQSAETAKPAPPSTPPPSPPTSPPPPSATKKPGVSTCAYQTEWGPMTITFDENTSTASGYYEYKSGQIQGRLWEGNVDGVWSQSDGRGRFHFVLGPDGFTGQWNLMGDQGWRGQWNGQLLGCD